MQSRRRSSTPIPAAALRPMYILYIYKLLLIKKYLIYNYVFIIYIIIINKYNYNYNYIFINN